MKRTNSIHIIFSVLFTLIILSCQKTDTSNTSNDNEVYARVIKSGVIKVAYLDYPPACMKDTKTGKMSGIFVEVLEKVASNLNLKIEWSEEVGWGSQIEGLDNDRYDIVGSPVWANPKRGKLTTLSQPVYYSGIGVYVRVNDKRFDNNLSKINSKEVKIGTIDGETSDLIASADFPLATKASSPENTDISQKFLDLDKGTCDVIFVEPYFAYQFTQKNEGKVKNIASSKPIRLFGNCYMMKNDEYQLKQMIDVAIEDLQNSGFIDKIIQKYEPIPNTFYRVNSPFKEIN